jgi:AraC-like DNA-binding protein
VESHLAERITLENTARRFWVSQSTITQTFRERMGVSFYRCVIQRRLIAAKSLIEQGVQLEDVGRQVGFTDYSTFYRAFKKEFGISPRQYRKLQNPED